MRQNLISFIRTCVMESQDKGDDGSVSQFQPFCVRGVRVEFLWAVQRDTF